MKTKELIDILEGFDEDAVVKLSTAVAQEDGEETDVICLVVEKYGISHVLMVEKVIYL